MTYVSDLIHVLTSSDREAEWKKLQGKEYKPMYEKDVDHTKFQELLQKDFSLAETRLFFGKRAAYLYSRVKFFENHTHLVQDKIGSAVELFDAKNKGEAFGKVVSDMSTMEDSGFVGGNAGSHLFSVVQDASRHGVESMVSSLSKTCNDIVMCGVTSKKFFEYYSRLELGQDEQKAAAIREITLAFLKTVYRDPENKITNLANCLDPSDPKFSPLLTLDVVNLMSSLYDENTLGEIDNSEFVSAVRLALSGDVGAGTADLCRFHGCLLGQNSL